ncbi:leucine-rich repeat-containing G-protein coupled receptor 6 [Hoplias malabaricus]|uniref:leucine-rich repeat-containing G-protein coupled receptor 6 n=1 Tax=Hoplias malabaricus TaxID=27720 RepID=UPI003462EEB0
MLVLLLLVCVCMRVCSGGVCSGDLCSAKCSCVEDGFLAMVDCSELGLSTVPLNISPFTSYLDLSMNNISEIQPNAFKNLTLLSELRLSGNRLRTISGSALNGLRNLKVLMLQNNQLERLDISDPWDLPNLLSLRLDANLISVVPAQTFSGMRSLRHLWLDDNSLSEVPVSALSELSALQAMTLALNRITHIPDHAFRNLSNLVVLHLHNNQIRTLGQNSFEGLRSLETLELNFNILEEFPVAIRTLAKLQELGFHNNQIRAIPERAFTGNPLLQTIHFYENPIQFVGRSAFQFLPKLHTLSLNGASEIREFPDLKGTTSLQVLTLTRAGLSTLPPNLCQQLPNLRVLELSHNAIEELPSFNHCTSLQEIGLQHNLIKHIDLKTFQIHTLRSLDLSCNRIQTIHPDAFRPLQSLSKLDLSDNQLSVLPIAGLTSVTHLKLTGNSAIFTSFRHEDFPNIRVIEMPHAYQCCVFGACSHRASEHSEEQTDGVDDDLQKRTQFPISSDYDPDLEEFQLNLEEARLQTSVQCTPIPGPFKPCSDLFGSWVLRLGMWLISLVSLLGNSVLVLTVFSSPSYLSPLKFIIGGIGVTNLLTGLCSGVLTVVDALTFGEFSLFGAQWESGAGCRGTAFLTVLSSEASVLLLTVAAVQCSFSVFRFCFHGKLASLGGIKAAVILCVVLSLGAAAMPAIGFGEYGGTPLCFLSPLPKDPPSNLSFSVALILMNSVCFLLITGCFLQLHCRLAREDFHSVWDSALIRHITALIFTNCVLYCPLAFLSFSSLMGLFPLSQEVVKSVLLVLLPLPACVNPVLYFLFNPHFREDVRLLLYRTRLDSEPTLDSFTSVDTEKSSYSSQTLVSFSSELNAVFPESGGRSPVPLIQCQLQTKENRVENWDESRSDAKDEDETRENSLFTKVCHSSSRSSALL